MNIDIRDLSFDTCVQYIKDGFHVLTVAESGFSMLDIYSRKYKISKALLSRFTDKVNSKMEAGSLHPLAPISALPRQFFRLEPRLQPPLDEIRREIDSFIEANRTRIMASDILVDFHVSSEAVPDEVIVLVVATFSKSTDADAIQNLVVRR
jgi:hypothetical protein